MNRTVGAPQATYFAWVRAVRTNQPAEVIAAAWQAADQAGRAWQAAQAATQATQTS